jgi:hypothetical protein
MSIDDDDPVSHAIRLLADVLYGRCCFPAA